MRNLFSLALFCSLVIFAGALQCYVGAKESKGGKVNQKKTEVSCSENKCAKSVFSQKVSSRKGESSEMSNEVRRGRRTSGDNMARSPAQHRDIE